MVSPALWAALNSPSTSLDVIMLTGGKIETEVALKAIYLINNGGEGGRNHLTLETALGLRHTAEVIGEPDAGSSQHAPLPVLHNSSLLFFMILVKHVSLYALDRTHRRCDTKTLAVNVNLSD